jgi:hypothetical protein
MRMTLSPSGAPKHWRGLGRRLWAAALAAMIIGSAIAPAHAAFTEPRLALMRATPFRSASGKTSLKLEGSFSFADAVQLGVPVSILVTQGQTTARFDLNGGVFTSVNGGPEQAAGGPGVIEFAPRSITVALPQGFGTGPATAQMIATYEGKPVASNKLGFSL